ncbi:Metallo-dependent phosphatase-like protein [Triangularia verruculosa]|uniref:Metallo-dependent phosphatase-like protein n=1 Tax=Triangularia verruculosa TaxID=2587418 RepID=A0AAN6XEQ4_9PEZI|nr:Metallo-dependent phosphatase-like protein [Triangularia verruculosa]
MLPHVVGRLIAATTLAPLVLACDDGCYGPIDEHASKHVRVVKRMQPGALDARYGPTRPLQWGQLNVLHTSDTHGWLSGHIKEANYGADWGDYVSFVSSMKWRAEQLGVDLLLLDSGDLHDGTGLSDSTTPNGEISNEIFVKQTGYDLLTIGNHELYASEVAYQTFNNFSRAWGDKYLTSNVQIMNPGTQEWEYVGKTHKYFTTENGLRIMAFGVLFDFTANTNASRITKAADMVKQKWFQQAIHHPEPVDVFLVLGHNSARPGRQASTMKTVYSAIREAHPDTPIQIFGGHSHMRDFVVYDQSSTASESGRYCESLGWFSMSGFNSSNSGFTGPHNPKDVPNPNRTAVKHSLITSPFLYSRRYLDWNRLTFDYHAPGSQFLHNAISGSANNLIASPISSNTSFQLKQAGAQISSSITAHRMQMGLGKVYGCTPQTFWLSGVSFMAPNSLFSFLADAMASQIVNPKRRNIPRVHISNTGMARFDLHKGPFTMDDSYITSPFPSLVVYIPDVPWSMAKGTLERMNAKGAGQGRRVEYNSTTKPKHKREELNWGILEGEECVNPTIGEFGVMGEKKLSKREEIMGVPVGNGGGRRQQVLEVGYTTEDDFGTDGDDTVHEKIPKHNIPAYFGTTAGLPQKKKGRTGRIQEPRTVDLVFNDFINDDLLAALGGNYTVDDIKFYMEPANYTLRDFLVPYVEKNWQAGMPHCEISGQRPRVG